MTVALRAGFREPWIEWDGITGVGPHAGRITLDGRVVPLVATWCNVTRHAHSHGYWVDQGLLCCTASSPDDPTPVSWWAPLENGLWANASVDDAGSEAALYDAYDGDYSIRVEEGTWRRHPDCAGWKECPGCWHDTVFREFESFDEYMAILRDWGTLVPES